MTDLELAWLRSWLEVVDSGGFARAAVRVHLSQPRISAHVASLEKALGCPRLPARRHVRVRHRGADRRHRHVERGRDCSALRRHGSRLLPSGRPFQGLTG
ncbi:LysR family transcriptional regulator [Actinoallomurus vinaceus]|uniref:LysR family transcriptional regulator n=1 Tax=Actinoallomurus vinaceus TaxID=1080074 RepID=UPI003CD069CD